jgi:hypothetical protein
LLVFLLTVSVPLGWFAWELQRARRQREAVERFLEAGGVAVLVMLIWFVVSLLLRRRFQFSFRSLLVFMLVLSVPLGWFAWRWES